MKTLLITAISAFVASAAFAGDVVIDNAKARESGGAWRFDVTLSHGDTGWNHYADAWRVVSEAGDVYGTRILHHPHVEEQPFTRSLSGVKLPAGVDKVWIEARDSVHGWNAARYEVKLR